MTNGPHPPARRGAGAYLLLLLVASFLMIVIATPVTGGPAQPAPAPPSAPGSDEAQDLPPIPEAAPTQTPAPPPYDFSQPAPETEPVENDWFANALFIGDSRTDGFRLYSGIRGASFLCHQGIAVFDMAEKKVIPLTPGGERVSVLEALSVAEPYGQIYIMLGVNELGHHDDEGFVAAYSTFVDQVRALQPDAVLYLQLLPPVNAAKAKANNQRSYVTNEKIDRYNELITALAQEKRTVLLAVPTGLIDETGQLPADMSTDGVHFSRAGYALWYESLMCHTVDPDAYRAGQINEEE